MVFNGINHGYTLKWRFKTDGFIAHLQFGSAIYVHTNFFNHIFGKCHHPVVILVRYINFHSRKFRIVRAIHTFVAEVFGKLVNAFETTYNKSFEV